MSSVHNRPQSTKPPTVEARAGVATSSHEAAWHVIARRSSQGEHLDADTESQGEWDLEERFLATPGDFGLIWSASSAIDRDPTESTGQWFEKVSEFMKTVPLSPTQWMIYWPEHGDGETSDADMRIPGANVALAAALAAVAPDLESSPDGDLGHVRQKFHELTSTVPRYASRLAALDCWTTPDMWDNYIDEMHQQREALAIDEPESIIEDWWNKLAVS